MYWAVAVDVYTFVILSLGLAVTLPSIAIAIGVKKLAIHNAEQINEHVARELTMRRRETVLPNRWPG